MVLDRLGLSFLTDVLYLKITILIILFKTLLKDGKIEYDGDSLFFTYEDGHKVDQIKKNQHVNLIYQTDDMLFIECTGNGEILKDKNMLKEKWVEGIDTPGICLIKVRASRVRFWHKEEEGEYIA